MLHVLSAQNVFSNNSFNLAHVCKSKTYFEKFDIKTCHVIFILCMIVTLNADLYCSLLDVHIALKIIATLFAFKVTLFVLC